MWVGRVKKASEPKQNGAAVKVNLPDNIVDAVAGAVGPAVAQGVSAALANLPPLKVQMPRMKRTAVRDPKTRELMGAIDEPMDDAG
jgi:hypothetical protein